MAFLLAFIASVLAGAPVPAIAYTLPLPGPVVRFFEPPPEPWLPGHRGVDLAGRPGDGVRAAAAGTVAFAGTVAGLGVVSIDHPDGIRTTYEPVTPLVRRGDRVDAGQVIGFLTAGGHAAGLHWGARRGGIYLDPLSLIRQKIRLKPLSPAVLSPAALSPAAGAALPRADPRPRSGRRSAPTPAAEPCHATGSG
ncbi:M23 family metallopeptidase [Hamadaea tsunoensis]|uniref:M23 family metallopeptidase n=1 Tax=Hamadaea tsunoensis TaxID=53368 RepID=UPI001FE02B38|nr:M23 family metallopeptidase [Hamadaea tsunoensis]